MRPSDRVPEDKQATLERLRGAIDAQQNAGRHGRASLATGWPEPDAAMLGGLMFGALHEWFGLATDSGPARPDPRRSPTLWTPPLGVLVHLAACAHRSPAREPKAPPVVLWIGRRVWPYGHTLARAHPALFHASLCIDAQRPDERFWAIDVALRSAGTGAVVVADSSGLPLAMSRRLQLAAEAGGALALLARPAWEEAELSVAATRWRVRTVAPPKGGPNTTPKWAQRWSIELVRCKGSLAHASHAHPWMVERTNDGRLVSLPPDLVNRSHPAALAS
jgi:protein ImuA